MNETDRRSRERRDGERRAGSTSRDLVPAGPVTDHDDGGKIGRGAARTAAEAAAFAAQVIGQDGQRRGLKGGPPVLDAARSTYLGTEYSGEKDRRPPAGKGTRTKV